MTNESKLRKQVGVPEPDEHSRLTSEMGDNHYGSNTPSLLSECSDHSSEEVTVRIADRKKKRLQKHHQPSRPKLVSTLSHIVRSAKQSEDEDEEDDIIEMPLNDLIIPELDPK